MTREQAQGVGSTPEKSNKSTNSYSEFVVLSDESIPATLTARKQWVGWKWGEHDGKPTKWPVDPLTGRNTDGPAAAWTYEQVVQGFRAGRCDGIGISIRAGLVGIDYDHVLDSEGEIKPEYAHIAAEIDAVGSYTEVSPSGEGLHILVQCDDIPAAEWDRTKNPKKVPELEFYHTGRYFTVTGRIWHQSPSTEITTVTAETLRPIYERIAGAGGGKGAPARVQTSHAEQQAPPDVIDTGELSFWAKFKLRCVKDYAGGWEPGKHGIPGGPDAASEAMQSVMTRAARELARIGYPVYHVSYAAAIYEIFLATPVYEAYYAPGKGHDAHPVKVEKTLDNAMAAGRKYYHDLGGE